MDFIRIKRKNKFNRLYFLSDIKAKLNITYFFIFFKKYANNK